MAKIKDFLAAELAQTQTVKGLGKPKLLVDGRSYGYVLLALFVLLMGNGMIIYAWHNAIRDSSCGHSKGTLFCDVYQAIPYPFSEIGLNALGCVLVAFAGAGLIRRLNDYWRIAGFDDRIELVNQDVIVSISLANLVPTLSIQVVRSSTIETLQFLDKKSGCVVCVPHVGIKNKDWKRLKEFVQGLPDFVQTPAVLKYIGDRRKALFRNAK